MRTLFAIFAAFLFTACSTPVPHVALDSGAAASLGISDKEWHDILNLAGDEKGWLPDVVFKVRKNLVEIQFEGFKRGQVLTI